MSNSWLLLNSFFILGTIIFSAGIVESLELSFSPSRLDFEGMPAFEECKSIKIYSDKSVILNLSVKWAEDGKYSSNIRDYSMELNPSLRVLVPSSIDTDRIEEIEMCITVQKVGSYSGILFLDAQGSSSSVGIWINVGKKGEKMNPSELDSASGVTGNSVFDINSGQIGHFGVFFFLSFFCFAEILVLVFLFIKLRRKIREKDV